MESIEFRMYSKKIHNLLLKAFHDLLEDPSLKRITVNHVKLNSKRTMATVYLDLGSVKDSKLALSKLNRLNPLFRSFLFKHLDKYRIPFFSFVEDKVLERGMRIESLLSENA